MLRTDLPEIITETLPGPKAQAIIDRREAVNPSAIKCVYPVVIEKGEGAMIQDVDGNKFLDWIGGVGVLNIGFSQPEVVEAVKAQAEKYFHGMYNVVTHEGYVALSEKLTQIAPVKGDKKKVFFANSGAEADENAVKIAKAFTKRPNIIVFSGAFHGRTLMTMSMTSKKAYAVGMGPFPDGVYRAQFPYYYRNPEGMPQEAALDYYLNSIKDVFEQCGPADSIAAIVVEPLQGEGGFIPAPIEWVKAVRKICDENGILMICDEVMAGFGRTGKMFAFEHWNVKPDIITFAKGVTSGYVQLGGIMISKEIAKFYEDKVFQYGLTYSGHSLACAAGVACVNYYKKAGLLENTQKVGKVLGELLEEIKQKHKCVGDVRYIGLFAAVEFVKDKETKEPLVPYADQSGTMGKIIGLLKERGFATFGRENNINIAPPLIITEEQLREAMKIFDEVLDIVDETYL